jgi:hypothetical protein
MFWDATNSRLGIGTNAPAYGLDVSSSVRFTNATAMSTGYSFSVNRLQFNNGVAGGNVGVIKSTSNGIINLTNAAELDFTRLCFGASSASFPALQRVSNALAVVDGTGSGTSNLLVGSTTDSGERLQVTGDVKVIGSGTTSGSSALTIKDSAGTDMLIMRNNGVLRVVKSYINLSTDQNVGFGGSNDGGTFNASGLGVAYAVANRNAAGVNYGFYGGNITNTSGAFYHIRTTGIPNFAPTSGTGTYHILSLESTINQTGGANGITRGLYVNPTLTAAADFRAIETTNGKVIFGNLPTSSAGLPSGAIWNDAGTIKIV